MRISALICMFEILVLCYELVVSLNLRMFSKAASINYGIKLV